MLKNLTISFVLILILSCNKLRNDFNNDNSSTVNYYLAKKDDSTLNYKQKLQFVDSAYRLAVKMPNNQKNRILLSEISFAFFKNQQLDKFKESTNILLRRARETKDTIMIAKSYRYVGSYYKSVKINDSSFYYYIEAKKIYKRYNLEEDYNNIIFFESIVKYNISDYIGADLGLRKAYNYFKKKNNLKQLSPICTQLGLTNNELKNYDKAIEYFMESLVINTNKNDTYLKSLCYNNLGLVYNNNKEYKKAIENFNLALSNKTIRKVDPELYGHLLDNLGFSYLKLGSNTNLPHLFYESLKVRDSMKDVPAIIVSNNHLSEYYQKKKDTTKSLYFVKKALGIAVKSKDPHNMVLALKQASLIDKKNASKYSEEYIRISDSLQLEERKNIDRFARIQLETDEIAQEKETAIRQKWVQTAIIATVLLIVILLFIIYRQRSHQKELLLLQNQQEANAEIYRLMLHQQTQTEEARQQEKQRIALELHDNVMNKLASSRFNLFPLTQNTDQTIQQHASQQAQTLKEIEDEIRSLTHELAQPQATDRNSFEQLLQAFTEDQNRRADIQFTLELDPAINWDTVASEAKMHLYRIVQEGVHNIRKHAEATKVSLRTIQTEESLCLEISDNGKGFDTTTAQKGIGLQNMKNRMKSVGGEVDICSQVNQGTTIRLRLTRPTI